MISRSVATLLVPVVEVVGRSGDSTIEELEIPDGLVLDGPGLTCVAGIIIDDNLIEVLVYYLV